MKRLAFVLFAAVAAVAACLVACSGSSAPSPPPGSAPPGANGAAPTYFGEIEPILHERCTRCHQPNNLAPFSLVTADDVIPKAKWIAAAVADGQMPPMPATAEDGCPPIDDPRVMPQAERDLVKRWVDTGAALGDPKPVREPPSPYGVLGAPTHTFENPFTYDAPSSGDDDYRCFVIEHGLPAPLGVSAVGVQPGNARMVHHATVYVVPPEGAGALRKLDADDPRPGYSCFGGVGVSQAVAAGFWVPGMTAVAPPRPGLGGWLVPNWPMVVQIHYNFANGRGSDRSSIIAWQSPQIVSEIPGSLILGDWTITLPPGEKRIVRDVMGDIVSNAQAANLGQVKEGLIYAAWAHQHLLGKSFRMDLVHVDGSSQCLLHIPKWNFHWQGIYRFKDPIEAKVGERVKVTCEWDNSVEGQPFVDGKRQPPRLVTYGEGTADEMCIGTLAVMNR
ncbi:MAG: hypothetical protein KF819_26360 [Labilithrix sp.]|nr:hypothetical protein [Labilithrix sp.]